MMQKSTIASASSVVTALLASLCCVGPFVFALIGTGSLGFATLFEPYRPYLLGLTILFLSAGFYFTYHKREVKCEDGTCKVESASAWQKLLLWLAAALTLVLMFFPQILTLI